MLMNACFSCNVCEASISKLVHQFIVFGEHVRYIGNINHFGDELAFHRRGLCVSRSAHLQMVAAVGLCQLLDWSCLTYGFPRPSSGRNFSEGKVMERL